MNSDLLGKRGFEGRVRRPGGAAWIVNGEWLEKERRGRVYLQSLSLSTIHKAISASGCVRSERLLISSLLNLGLVFTCLLLKLTELQKLHFTVFSVFVLEGDGVVLGFEAVEVADFGTVRVGEYLFFQIGAV